MSPAEVPPRGLKGAGENEIGIFAPGENSRKLVRTAPITMFLLLGGLVLVTTVLAKWYDHERHIRAERDYVLGLELARVGRNERALQLYRRALELARNDRRYRLAISVQLISLGRLDEASIYLHDLLLSDPSASVPNLMLARIASSGGDIATAIDYYNRAIYGNWAGSSEDNRLSARWELVNMLHRNRRINDAVAETLKIAAENPSDDGVRLRAATTLLELGSNTHAADLFQEISRKRGAKPQAYAGLGAAELALRDYAAAESALTKALRENPADNASRKRLELASTVLELDPTRRNLTPAERYRRSKELLARTAGYFELCEGADATPGSASGDRPLARARRLLKLQVSSRFYLQAAEKNTLLAEHLWTTRKGACAQKTVAGPLDLVFSHLLR